MHDKETRYIAVVAIGGTYLYRLLESPDCHVECFRSRHEENKAQLWPPDDFLAHRGISAFEHEWQARKLGQSVNAKREQIGQAKRWTHLVRFYVDGHQGFVFAREGAEGHFSVWGEADKLALTVEDPIPI
jgi:hypothetical protein